MTRRPCEWTGEQAGQFRLALSVMPTGRLGSAGYDYALVRDVCEAVGIVHPAQMGESMRARFLERLLSEPGRALYSAVAAGRGLLLQAAREQRKALGPVRFAEYALQAGLVSGGKPRTAPASMTCRELWLLLSAIPLPAREEEVQPGHLVCGDCGQDILGLCKRCPRCHSQLLEAA